MAEKVIKAVVLRIEQKAENEFLVSFFTLYGYLALFTQGLNKQTSKNRANLQIGALVEIEYFRSRLKNRIGRLKKAHFIHNFDITNAIINLFFLKLVKLFQHLKFPNHLFEIYVKNLSKYNTSNVEKYLTYFYAQATTYFGIKPSFNSCYICGSRKNLIDFSINNGGFICSNHNHQFNQTTEKLQVF